MKEFTSEFGERIRGWHWELIDRFCEELNPRHQEIFQSYAISYYWTCFQCVFGSLRTHVRIVPVEHRAVPPRISFRIEVLKDELG